MNTETLTCNSCGAPLEVPVSANFVTCNHCSCQLAVRRSESATFTEQFDRLAEKTDQLSSRVDKLSTQNEMAALDREWQLERETYMVSGKHGHRSLPTQLGSAVGGIIAAFFGLFLTVSGAGAGAGPETLFGFVFIALGVGSAINGFTKASNYKDAERRYRRRRGKLKADASR